MGYQLPNFAKTQCYTITKDVDVADWLADKGEALAAADIYAAITIPAKCIRLAAGINPVTAANADAATFDLGDGDDADSCVDGFDATQIVTDGVPIMTNIKYYPTSDTLDVTLATLTGTLSSGKVQVWAVLIDVT